MFARPSKSSSRSRAAKGGVGSSRALAPAADVPALLREVLGRAAPQASAALLEPPGHLGRRPKRSGTTERRPDTTAPPVTAPERRFSGAPAAPER